MVMETRPATSDNGNNGNPVSKPRKLAPLQQLPTTASASAAARRSSLESRGRKGLANSHGLHLSVNFTRKGGWPRAAGTLDPLAAPRTPPTPGGSAAAATAGADADDEDDDMNNA